VSGVHYPQPISLFADEGSHGQPVEQRMDIGFYLVNWKGNPDDRDWSEEPYENLYDKGELTKCHRQNLLAAMGNSMVWLTWFFFHTDGFFCVTRHLKNVFGYLGNRGHVFPNQAT
jgi:hypothetical protein